METIIRCMFLGGGWIPLVGAVSLVGLLVFAIATLIIHLLRPAAERDLRLFCGVLRWQFVFFLLTHTVFSLADAGLNVRHSPELAQWMRFLSVALVGLAVELPACLLAAGAILVTCRGPWFFQHRHGIVVAFIVVCIVEYVTFNTTRVSIEIRGIVPTSALNGCSVVVVTDRPGQARLGVPIRVVDEANLAAGGR